MFQRGYPNHVWTHMNDGCRAIDMINAQAMLCIMCYNETINNVIIVQ
jgi:hypothetical protein